jgi:multiple RNA-binding domain-containing protein 1
MFFCITDGFSNFFTKAFSSLAYKQFKGAPLFLEWAPIGIFDGKPKVSDSEEEEEEEEINAEDNKENSNVHSEMSINPTERAESVKESKEIVEKDKEDEENEEEKTSKLTTTLYVKNLNFITTEETLKAVFGKIGRVSCVNPFIWTSPS